MSFVSRREQDRANKIVILTGAGGEFIPGIDFTSFGNFADPCVLSQVHDEGVQILESIVNIRVPIIAAVEGRAHVHSEYALLANVIVAGEGVTFHDAPHFVGGIVPGDAGLDGAELERWIEAVKLGGADQDRQTVPSAACGQMNRPFSNRFANRQRRKVPERA